VSSAAIVSAVWFTSTSWQRDRICEPYRCATPATRSRSGSKRADQLGGAAAVYGSASMRFAVDEAPDFKGQPLGVRQHAVSYARIGATESTDAARPDRVVAKHSVA
jgi:hypothetical protein